MNRFKKFMILSRWEYLPSAINETGVPALLALFYIPFSSAYLFRVFLSLIVWWIAHFIGAQVNNLVDYNSDQHFKSHLSEAIDYFSVSTVKKIIFVELLINSALVLFLAFYYQLPALVILWILGVFFAVGYSVGPLHFKSRVIMNPVCLGFVLYLIPMLFAYNLIAGGFHLFSVLVITLFSFQMYPMFFMDEISDYEEDKEARINNPCVHYGRRPTIIISIVMYAFAVIAMLIVALSQYIPMVTPQKILFVLALMIFILVELDFCYIFTLADPKKIQYPDKLLKLKKRISTPLWLMGSGVATILLLLVDLIK